MTSTFLIFAAIAVIQFLAQAVAKASEKRKKALLKSGGGPESRPQPPTSAEKADLQPSGTAALIVESVKDSILEASGIPGATSSAKSSTNEATVVELRKRRIEALRRRQEAIAASEASASTPQASNRPAQRSPQPPAQPPMTPMKRSDQEVDSSRRSNRSRDAKSPRKTISKAKSISSGQIGTQLRKRLRDPRSFREAFVLSELLQPPVAMRKPADQG